MYECECELRMRQNESLHVANGPNVNALLATKSLYTQSHHRVALTTWREKTTLVP